MTPKNNDNDQKRINQLLTMLWNAKSTARVISIADQILEISPNNTEALILKADNIDDSDEQIKLLLRALSTIGESEDYDLYFTALNHRLAYIYFVKENFSEAIKYCEHAINYADEHENNADEFDDKILTDVKALYYRILIHYKEWNKILTQTMKDSENSLARAYAKLIAVWSTAPENKRQNLCAGMFWDALMLAPDVPFYILGFFEEPDDNASSEVLEDFNFALLYYDTVSISEEFHQWFSRGTILFGLLSGRFDNEEYDYMLDALDNFGGYLEYQRMRRILTSTEDEEVIETLAANKCLAE